MLSNRIAVDSWGKLWGDCPRCWSRRARVDRFSCCDDVWRTAGLRTRPWSNRRGDGDDRSKDVRELIARRRNRWLRLVVALEPSMWSIFHGWCVDRFWCFFFSVARCAGGSCIVSSRHEKVELKGCVSRIFLDILRKIEDSWHLRGTAGQRKGIFLCSKIFNITVGKSEKNDNLHSSYSIYRKAGLDINIHKSVNFTVVWIHMVYITHNKWTL